MDHNWGFVAAGYSITTVAVGGYFLWLRTKLRRAERAAGEDD
jgi:hypothetical protein